MEQLNNEQSDTNQRPDEAADPTVNRHRYYSDIIPHIAGGNSTRTRPGTISRASAGGVSGHSPDIQNTPPDQEHD